MKMFGYYKNAAALMLPGVVTGEGFLGEDKRNLVDIIQQDEAVFRSLGLEWEEVAEKLQYLQQQAEGWLGEPVTVDGKWIVQCGNTRGRLPCPFGDKLLGKSTTTIIAAGTEGQVRMKQIIYNELSLHLLAQHHFLQGRGSPFRLEPKLLKQVLQADG